MSLIELIGFVVTMLAMILLFGKRVKEERRRRESPHDYEEGLPSTDPLKQFLKALSSEEEDDDEEDEALPQLPRSKKQDKRFLEHPKLTAKPADYHNESNNDSRKKVSNLDHRYTDHAYEVHKTFKVSYGAKVVSQLRSRRDMMICHEIFTKPKGW